VIPWPHLPLPGSINEAVEETHELLAWIGLALVVLHVAGALRHQFLLRDGLLRRIGPGGSAWAAGLLALLVVALYFGTGMRISNWVMANGGYGPPRAAAPVEATAVAPEATPTPTDTATPTDAATEAASGPPPVWTIRPGGSLGFTVTSGADSYRGSFSDWSGTITFDPENPETADLRIDVRLASGSVGDETMDGMLQGAEFLAASGNPTASWRSTSVRRTGPNRYSASGTLSLKGASRPQALTFTLSGEGLKRHVEGSATIDRTAFAVGTGESAQGLASSVALSFAFDATGRAP
jgi:polyisoprenoid-binding protein YceI